MSTIDPIAARRAKAERAPGALRVGLNLVVLVIGGYLTGVGWTEMSADVTESPPSTVTMAAVPVGMTLTVIGLIAWGPLLLRSSKLGIAQGLAAAASGGGLGTWTTAREIESRVAERVGLGLLVLAAALLLLSLFAYRRRIARARLAEELMKTGTRTLATVSDKGYTASSEGSSVFTTVTFTFHDAHGVQRWVQRPMMVRRAAPITDGQTTDLWYDAQDPGNDKHIVVALALESMRIKPPTPS
ncbi:MULTISPECIES: DUF3592 domain-containing protein [unclassified Nocardioides]|uniref:DUF3592 domain-containing protein n=1 Tax=unclassified Nocardioides TaxID=2615069 RepID=UPI000702F7F8|nr:MULTISPECIES: DUF3592 domain-containing protein [unclassified Nocardioides]KQZ76044.1 hypothetical protein ASD66_07085 [Nocardioides sp. Root151]KRF15117.1 hypothetical protein ASH02_12855 [Nocardioides sp. Soil796]